MRILYYIKTTIFYKFLIDVYKEKRIAFYFICIIIITHLGANLIRSSIFPVFIYSMYSEPQTTIPTTTSRYVFFANDTLIKMPSLFVQGRLSGPIERYQKLLKYGNTSQIVDKRMHYLSYLLPVNMVNSLREILYSKCFTLNNFQSWYKEYFYQYLPIKYFRLTVYQYEFAINELGKPQKITPIITFYE